MNKKMNNKGFSLVELIVVIAIMGILAVTLAPRLTQYIEKARMASDKEAVNSIYTVVKYANMELPLGNSKDQDLGAGSAAATPLIFEISADGKTWTPEATFAPTDATETDFWASVLNGLGNFVLKSNKVVAPNATSGAAGTQINVTTSATGQITITLDYDGTGYDSADGDYQIVEP